MNQNPHWKQLIWNWASIIFGNALYSLAVALFLEPAGRLHVDEALMEELKAIKARLASHWPSGD